MPTTRELDALVSPPGPIIGFVGLLIVRIGLTLPDASSAILAVRSLADLGLIALLVRLLFMVRRAGESLEQTSLISFPIAGILLGAIALGRDLGALIQGR